MGPIKINIKTDTSEYGGGPDTQVNENVQNKAEEDSNKENDIVKGKNGGRNCVFPMAAVLAHEKAHFKLYTSSN